MVKKFLLIIICLLAFSMIDIYGGEREIKEYQGVVTILNIPAKVMQLNEIIENPKPGTSYIGEEGIVVEIDEIPEVMANWTILHVKYYQYPEPKVIRYKLLSERKEVTVKYRAVSVEIVGDLSLYIKQ